MVYPVRINCSANTTRLFVRLTMLDCAQAQVLLDEAIGPKAVVKRISKTIESKVFVNVSGYGNVAPYVRARPGMAGTGRTIGKEFFQGLGALLSVGFQGWEDRNRSDLNGSQKLGRASVAVLDVLPPIALAHFGAKLLWPTQTDQFIAGAFSSRGWAAPFYDWSSDRILQVGGKPFQEWSLRPSIVDFMSI